jgi:hypothetical protein
MEVFAGELGWSLMWFAPEALVFFAPREPALGVIVVGEVLPELRSAGHAVLVADEPCGEAEAEVEAYDHARCFFG